MTANSRVAGSPWGDVLGKILEREVEADFLLRTLGIDLGFATGFLGGRLVSAQTAHFIEDAFLVEFAFQTLERAINGLTFFDDYFWHKDSFVKSVVGLLKLVWKVKSSENLSAVKLSFKKSSACDDRHIINLDEVCGFS